MSPKEQIRMLRDSISKMQNQRIEMIKAFQLAFGALQGKVNDIVKAVHILGGENPEILKLLPLQSEEGSDEAGSGDGKQGVLPVSSAGTDPRPSDTSAPGEDEASCQASGPSGSP